MNPNNLEEYSDPILYDIENNTFEPDGPFYLALAQRIGGPVLELGCGTGRITIPMAQQGMTMTGLDIVPGMLALARQKAQSLPIQWVEADARSFKLGRQFRFIFESGSMFQHLLDRADQEALLACVRDHLEPEGRFVVGVMYPDANMLAHVENEEDWFSYANTQGQEVRVSGTQHYDRVRQIKTETAYRRWRDADGHEVVQSAPLRLRYVFPQELESLLHYNGFAVCERYGDLDFSPLTEASQHIIYLCQKRA